MSAAVLDRPRSVIACEVCIEERPADWEYTGNKIDARWFCAEHAERCQQSVDRDMSHWSRVHGNHS